MNEFEIYLIDKSGIISTITRKVQSERRPKTGAESVFIPLNEKIGIKAFRLKREARSAMNRQHKAFKDGIAPRVIERYIYEVIAPVGGTYLSSPMCWTKIRSKPKYKNIHRRLYAYKTEIVDKTYGRLIPKKDREKFDYLCKKMEELKYSTEDLHSYNVGMIGDRMVCLDFGDLSST